MFITVSHNGVTAWGDLDGEMILHGFDDYTFINMPETAPVREQWHHLWHEIRLFIHENTVLYDANAIEDDFPYDANVIEDDCIDIDWTFFDE